MLNLLGDRKKLAGTIVESMLGGSPKREDPKTDIDMGVMTAVEEMMEAIRSGDAKALADALGGFVDMKSHQFQSKKEMPTITAEDSDGGNDFRGTETSI
jgi:chemotaxis protein CheY-P-specific phosphatase CheC